MDLLSFILLLSINIFGPASTNQNYIEIEIKYWEPNYIQLFEITADSVSFFSEKQSYWKHITPKKEFQKIRWDLRDVQYNKFRIDLSTRANQTIEIKSILVHVNEEIIKLNGKEIFAFFTPNIFLKLISANSESVVFKSVELNNFTDPSISGKVTSNLNPNTNIKIDLKCSSRGVLAIGLTDEENETYGRAIYINSSTTQITLPLYLKSRPTSIYIQPSISNENEILIKEVSLAYGIDKIVWDGNDIKSKFKYNGEYYRLDNYDSKYFVQTKIDSNRSTFMLWHTKLEYPRDYYKRLGLGILALVLMLIILSNANRFLLSKNILT